MPTATGERLRRVMAITTPLGDDVLLFHGMHAREELSRLFEYQLDLLSMRSDIDLDEILGTNVTVSLALPDDSPRYFNGYVTRFAHSGMHGRYHRYTAVVRPWLWFLTRTADCRIFQNMTVPDILKEVFSDHTAADFALELTSTYRAWAYCVQYRETDFNFISRLLEHEGIYYYFRHTDGHNTMVLTDSTSKHQTRPGYEQLPFIPPGSLVRPDIEHIDSWDFAREVQPGVYVHDDYDLERPSVDLRTRKALPRSYASSDHEIYDYPGHYAQAQDGEQYAAVRIDEYGSQFEIVHASTNARGISVGSLFTLDRHPRADQNREHLVLAASYDLAFSQYEALPEGEGSSYRCTLTAMSSVQQFRPKRVTPKPFVQGPQTAVVVGPAGEEIYKDDYGRVKVKFHWDRNPKRDENSSCWIRVAQPWAGKGWGSVSTPRIGHEVVVDFLEGDPDQPIIIGNVYNAENMPPHGGVVSGLKSQTHKGSGYNELSMDDTAGQEKITIHGQRDMITTVEHDQTDTIKNNRTTSVAVNDTESVGSDQAIKVGANQTLKVEADQSTEVGATRTASVGLDDKEIVGSNQTVEVGANQAIEVKANQDTSVGADRSVVVSGSDNLEIKGGDQSIKLWMGNRSVNAALGKISDEAMQSIELTVGQSSIKIDQSGVTIKGLMVKVEGQTSTEVKGLMTNIEGAAMLTAKGGLVMIG